MSGNDTITNGSSLVVPNLVTAAGTPNPAAITNGTPFLTQLQNDLSAELDDLLAQVGDSASITTALNNQILARFAAAFGAAGIGSSSTSFAIFWLDPVSICARDAPARAAGHLQRSEKRGGGHRQPDLRFRRRQR